MHTDAPGAFPAHAGNDCKTQIDPGTRPEYTAALRYPGFIQAIVMNIWLEIAFWAILVVSLIGRIWCHPLGILVDQVVGDHSFRSKREKLGT